MPNQIADLFEIIKKIDQAEFLQTWRREEDMSGHDTDGFTLARMKEFQDCKKLDYYVVRLTANGLGNLILSSHEHPKDVSRVNEDGEAYPSVISKYLAWRSQGQDDACFQRMENVWQFISSKLNECGNLFESEFLLGRIFRPGDTDLPQYCQSYTGTGLRTLNFHRFVAYGMWCAEHGFQPAKVHYFTQASTGI
jgi:hypothetical protein